MLIRMRVTRDWQNAGRERPLQAGQTYDVADPVALALLRDGSAEAVMAAPETKPKAPPETKTQQKRKS